MRESKLLGNVVDHSTIKIELARLPSFRLQVEQCQGDQVEGKTVKGIFRGAGNGDEGNNISCKGEKHESFFYLAPNL